MARPVTGIRWGSRATPWLQVDLGGVTSRRRRASRNSGRLNRGDFRLCPNAGALGVVEHVLHEVEQLMRPKGLGERAIRPLLSGHLQEIHT